VIESGEGATVALIAIHASRVVKEDVKIAIALSTREQWELVSQGRTAIPSLQEGRVPSENQETVPIDDAPEQVPLQTLT
jgi:hypothetical protein